jgi:hypothetical protein
MAYTKSVPLPIRGILPVVAYCEPAALIPDFGQRYMSNALY